MEPHVVAAAAQSGNRLPLEVYLAHGAEAGLTWTTLRKLVFDLIWNEEKPLGAYQAAAFLSTSGRVVHPTSVYRCLRCFEEAGLVLPVVTWNRYLLSPNPAVSWWGLLLCRVCRSCTPFEFAAEHRWLGPAICARGFAPQRYSAECEGRCRTCADNACRDGPGAVIERGAPRPRRR